MERTRSSSPIDRAPALALLLAALAGSVHAAAPLDPQGDYLLGDWGGLRDHLKRDGVAVDLGYTSESAYNLDGGFNRDHKLAYADQFALGATLDLDKLFGLRDALLQITLTNRNGEDLTAERLVDPASGQVSSVQEVYGRGNVTRLTQFWYQQRFLDGGLTVKVGRIPLSDDFATLDTGFQNLFLGASQPGNQAGEIWYNWPVSQWAAQARLAGANETYLLAGVFDLNPENLDPDNGLDLYNHGSQGVIAPLELGWEPEHGPGGLPGKYKIGAYYSNADAPDYRDGGDSGRRYGAWFVIQQQVTRRAGDRDRGLSLFVQGTWNDERTAYAERYVSTGATWSGPFDARPHDDAGIGLAYARVGEPYVDQATAGNIGLPGPGAPGYVPPQGEEWNAELYYGFQLTPWLAVRPNLQYIVHPGANNRVDDAWVAGAMFNVTL
tara:strand:+ start:2368 stop:3681 length:1314 start_codon:yes stop_codon:yes gene_type:complete